MPDVFAEVTGSDGNAYVFQFSIGDAVILLIMSLIELSLDFQFSIGDAVRR